jgi:hypothetical protein
MRLACGSRRFLRLRLPSWQSVRGSGPAPVIAAPAARAIRSKSARRPNWLLSETRQPCQRCLHQWTFARCFRLTPHSDQVARARMPGRPADLGSASWLRALASTRLDQCYGSVRQCSAPTHDRVHVLRRRHHPRRRPLVQSPGWLFVICCAACATAVLVAPGWRPAWVAGRLPADGLRPGSVVPRADGAPSAVTP